MNLPHLNFHKRIFKNTFDPSDDVSYQNYLIEELILRDHLAVDRTMLQNENTFLAYIRTSLTVLVVGVTLLHIFNDAFSRVAGISLILLGIFLFIFGYHRAIRVQKKINTLRKRGDREAAQALRQDL